MRRRRLEHPIAAPLPAVERALLSEATLDELAAALPEVGRAREEERWQRGRTVFRAARFVARITPPLFGRVIEGDDLEWREEVTWSLDEHAGTFRVRPNLAPRRAEVFRCEGTYRLEPDGGGTRRIVEVEIEVDLRVVGPTIERVVEAPLPAHFRVEAEVLERLAR